ncbi:MAG TPA: hypothetical protein V6D33_12420 [Cyanophyceae cyanobacterium]
MTEKTHNEQLTKKFREALLQAASGNVSKAHKLMDEYDQLAGQSSRPSPRSDRQE